MSPEAIRNKLITLKSYRPAMIVWAISNGDDVEFYATPTRHAMNRALRSGKLVYVLQ